MVVRHLTRSDAAGALETLQRRLAAAGLDLPLRLWDDRTLGPDDAGYRLVLCHPWSLRAMLLPPSELRLGESYLRDAVDVEGSMVAALRDVARLRDGLTASGERALLGVLLRVPSPPRDPAHHMVRHVEQAGFELRDVEQLRPHYARTTAQWVANIEADYDHLRELVGERTVRIWRAYLAGSSLAFNRGDLGVIQILATRERTVLPLDRDHLALGHSDHEVAETGGGA